MTVVDMSNLGAALMFFRRSTMPYARPFQFACLFATAAGVTATVTGLLTMEATGDIRLSAPIAAGVFCAFQAVAIFLMTRASRQAYLATNKINRFLRNLADGQHDLSTRLELQRHEILGDVGASVNCFIDRVQQLVQRIAESAQQVSNASEEIARASSSFQVDPVSIALKTGFETLPCDVGSVTTAVSMQTISDRIQEIERRMAEMSGSIHEVAVNAEESTRTAAIAQSIVTESTGRIADLRLSAEAIDRIIEVIQDIAEQTNLLALNATIEAARAGQSGRGFAIVAKEVKELAKQTAEASNEIRAKIHGIQDTTASAVESIQAIRDSVNRVTDSIGMIAVAVEQQSTAASQITNSVSFTSQTLGTATDTLGDSRRRLSQLAEELEGSVSQFLA